MTLGEAVKEDGGRTIPTHLAVDGPGQYGSLQQTPGLAFTPVCVWERACTCASPGSWPAGILHPPRTHTSLESGRASPWH